MSFIEIVLAANGSDVIVEVPIDPIAHRKIAQLKIRTFLEIILEKDMAKKALRRSLETIWNFSIRRRYASGFDKSREFYTILKVSKMFQTQVVFLSVRA